MRHLRGNLGVAAIVFMVVAAAAPLGVIGGVVPLGIASGNGAGFPATFIIATVILLFFAVGFTAMTPYVDEAGAFFSYVRKSLGFRLASASRSSRSSATWRSKRGSTACSVRGRQRRRALRRPRAAVVAVRGGGLRGDDLPRLPQHELSSRVLAVLLTAEIAIVAILDLVIVVQGGDHGLSNGIVNPHAILSGSLGIGLLFAIISYVGFERRRSSATRHARPSGPSRARPMWRSS